MAQAMSQPPEVTEQDVHDGLPVSTLASLSASLDVPATDLIEWLHISQRTWARRKAAGRFDTLESDRVARLTRLVRRATDVLGDSEGARTWLRTPARALGRRPPLEVASTEVGAETVFELLGRLEHGVYT